MKPHFACLCLLLLSNHCLGQDPGASEAPSNTPSAEPVQLPQPPTDTSTPGFQLVEDGGARAAAEKYLESKGWSVGWDAAKGWGVYIGVSDLLAADCNGLSLSMEAAVLDAKFQFAEFLGAEASAATLKVADKNPTQRREELDRLDALIKRPGGDPAAETIRDLLQLATSDDTSVAWRNTIVSAGRTAMQRCIYGMVVINTFVDTGATGLEGTIAVVVMYTPKSRLMADALLGARSVPSDQPQGSIKDYVDGLPYDQLAFASGARHRVNERGDRCLLGFGMSSVDGSDPADIQFAMEEATQSATAQLRLVAGELIEADRLSSRTADARKLLDGTVKRESLKSFQNRVSSRAESLQMSGVTTVTTKRLRHNKLGDVVCVVRQWNLSDAKAAAALRAILDEQGGWKGGRGVVPDGRGGTASSSRPIKPSGVPSGSSGETMDDP